MAEYTWITGIDPSLTGTGVAWADGELFTIKPRTVGDERLAEIATILSKRLIQRRPYLLVVMEDLPTHAGAAGLTGMVQGAIRAALIRLEIPYVTVPPASLKKYATGKGNATKPDMRMAMYQRAGVDERDDNKVDAFWLRQLGLYAVGHSEAIAMPKVNREAALKVPWPDDITDHLLEPYEVLDGEVAS